jgi:homogentisate 1,2-dioxygenase
MDSCAERVNFVQGLVTVCCAGSASTKDGYAIHIYTATEDMKDCCLCNADGDFLIVPQQGVVLFLTVAA